MEAQFRNNRVSSDQTKFDIIVAALDPQYLEAVADIIRNLPIQNKFDRLKEQLIAEYADSQQKKIKKLIQGIDLGDNKPSTLLRKIKDLATGSMNNEFIESLWLSKLPETVRSIVTSINSDLKGKADAADKIMEVTKFETSAVQTPAIVQPSSSNNNDGNDLIKQIHELLSKNFKHGRSRSHNRRGRSKSNGNNNKSVKEN